MIINSDLVRSKFPKRPKDANKGTFGKALIIAGSKNFPGAAILSVTAAARTGAGLVTLATPPEVLKQSLQKDSSLESFYKAVVPKIPFATFLDFSEIENSMGNYDAILIGPGLGKDGEVNKLISELVNWRNKKLVIDADALNILSETKDWHKSLEMDAILTPHPGEMSKLTGLSIDEIQKNRERVVLEFSKSWNKTIVLKGAKTVIVNPSGQIFISPFSNPLLATAGTGDVLSGIIAGLLAQGLSLVDASIVGVYSHGMVGEKLKEKFGDSGAIATDLVELIPQVMKDLKSS